MRERYKVTETEERDVSKPGVKHKKMYAIVDHKLPLPNSFTAIWKKKFYRQWLPERYETREEAQVECDRLNQLNIGTTEDA